MDATHDLTARRTQRHDVALRVRLSLMPESSAQVRLTQASGVREGWIDADLVDLASGGAGLLSPVYLPRHALMTIRIAAEHALGKEMDLNARVQRVIMTDRRPMYLIGTSFDALPADQRERLHALLDRFHSENAA
jgi:hypothetical protein